jgi:hypothetical protein
MCDFIEFSNAPFFPKGTRRSTAISQAVCKAPFRERRERDGKKFILSTKIMVEPND